MKHPLTRNNAYLFYIIIWVGIMLAHTGILHLFFKFPISIAIIDGLVFNSIIALLGFAFGFAFYYLDTDSSRTNTFVSYIALILVGAGGAYYISDTLLSRLLIEDVAFLQFTAEARLWRISASAFYFASVLICYYFIRYNDQLKNQKDNEARLETLLKETELDALKSQINPHFIFNSLNSISSLTITAPEKAQEMVIKLSDFLRYSLGNDKSEFSTLEEELGNISLYLEIEKVRFGNRLEVSSKIDSETKKARLPNMILQPLFENAIKYGLYESFENIAIETIAECKNDSLIVTIRNSFDPTSAVKKGKGIGLKNIRERLRIYYGSNQLLQTSIKENYFIATIEVPQQTETT